MPIAAIILAAGHSRRFGDDDKRLAMIDGEPLLRRVARRVGESSVASVLVVIGAEVEHGAGIARALRGLPAEQVINLGSRDGMGTSIAAGVAALGPAIDGVLIVPADMPDVSPALIDLLIEKSRTHADATIIVPCDRDGRQRNPVLWMSPHFPALTKLDGPAGGKELIKVHAAEVATVIWPDAKAFHDIDTRAELSVYLEKSGEASQHDRPKGE